MPTSLQLKGGGDFLCRVNPNPKEVDVPVDELPYEFPCCPICEQPMSSNETMAIEGVRTPHGTIIRMVHNMCSEEDDE